MPFAPLNCPSQGSRFCTLNESYGWRFDANLMWRPAPIPCKCMWRLSRLSEAAYPMGIRSPPLSMCMSLCVSPVDWKGVGPCLDSLVVLVLTTTLGSRSEMQKSWREKAHRNEKGTTKATHKNRFCSFVKLWDFRYDAKEPELGYLAVARGQTVQVLLSTRTSAEARFKHTLRM